MGGQVLLPPRSYLNIRAADTKEVGVGNPAEETCCHPNNLNVTFLQRSVNKVREKACENTSYEDIQCAPCNFDKNRPLDGFIYSHHHAQQTTICEP